MLLFVGNEKKEGERIFFFFLGRKDFKNINNFSHFPVLPRAANGTDRNSFTQESYKRRVAVLCCPPARRRQLL